ncbi:hypothetical protein [Algoriphagus boritolerans]|uniref:Uncharacterized protein n=1 Tax=Algoriphagus boritolerans DSM 17298 = JCM 18970 TaxID=1120964 RepID=A0A1H5WNH8_9BACT|nr:hypothetical protein [Algoriphagus boritolerans]SEG01022.1 hypothetical protein SAMN03080598_02186 [Algoriphagus boritolerans DSM 17298 = JCM 18970]
MDQQVIVKTFRENGQVTIQEGNGKNLTLLKMENWEPEMGFDWTFLLFDMFQIRTVCEPFAEVSLDVVEFASKPTIYHSPVSKVIKNAPIQDGNIRFSLIREPNWNKLLFQISQPVLSKIGYLTDQADTQTELYFPLLSPSTKEMFLGPEGDVKIVNR